MLPQALIKSLQNVKGFDEEAFKKVHASGMQVTSVRLNPDKKVNGEWSMFNEEPVPWCRYGKYLTERPSFTFDPLFHGGAYYVQEASSMFLWHVLQQAVGAETTGLKVLDLCAAPGGKSTLLASYFKDGLLVSNEVIKSRANILVENITKWGNDNVIVTNNDPKDFSSLENYFDVIVVDAPCSGSGLFRKDPDAINEWSEANVALCSHRQQRILADIYPALKKDGILIYSTCSYSKEEDEDILNWMSGEFNVSGVKLKIEDEWSIVETITSKKNYGYRFYPDKVKGEGFFIAAFKKNDGYGNDFKPLSIPSISKNENALIKEWIKNDQSLFFFKQADNIIAIPQQWKNDLALLQKSLYLRKAGITIGSLKGKDVIPDHELALSLLMNDRVPVVYVSKEQALQYLKRKEFIIEDSVKGWALVNYCGINLGWMKVLHNRINNYYPVNWRILKD
ncbi:RNA methyltransferase [Panacibacter ginsenosidivorans]|uniref:RNA methyltransferase n=2 Tax=Panacibacter ginsenosidivorans TaxID=1813871 RepID=A0A5B8VGM0_9BACT|nr:RNA methyltransferase [Panacibacter ginsenosidivorans]